MMPAKVPRVRVGIAGLGLAGTAILPALVKHPNIEITAAANQGGRGLAAFARDFQAETYQNVEDLCKNASVDALYIATPTHLHKEHVLIAAAHRKHILVEKPLCITLKDADEMIAALERNGVQMVVGHSHSFDPPIRKMREIIRTGILGRVRMINSWHFTDWLYRPRVPEELDTRQGGGVTFRQGAHQFDIIRYLGGGLIRSVRAIMIFRHSIEKHYQIWGLLLTRHGYGATMSGLLKHAIHRAITGSESELIYGLDMKRSKP